MHKVEVIAVDRLDAPQLAMFAGHGLASIARVIGSGDNAASTGAIPPGGTLVLFLEVLIPERQPIAERIVHRLSLDENMVGTAAIPMVRRYAHMSVKHLEPFADRLTFDPGAIARGSDGEPAAAASQNHPQRRFGRACALPPWTG